MLQRWPPIGWGWAVTVPAHVVARDEETIAHRATVHKSYVRQTTGVPSRRLRCGSQSGETCVNYSVVYVCLVDTVIVKTCS